MKTIWVRSAALAGAPELIEELGFSPGALLREAGLDPASLSNPDFPIPIARVVGFLEKAAEACRCENFGLELSKRQNLASILGPIWSIFESAPTVGAVFRGLVEFFPLHTRGAIVSIEVVPGGIVVNYDMAAGIAGPRRQIVELGAGLISLQVQQWAPGWRPKETQCRHRPPATLTLHRQILGPNVTFNSDRNAMFLENEVLALRKPSGDAGVHRRLAANFSRERWALPGRHQAEMENLLRGLLPFAPCDLRVCARLLRLTPRTLQRRLAQEGTSFAGIVDRVRADLALSYFHDSDLKAAAIAEILQFSETSALSRAFRRWYGVTPRQARKVRPSLAFGLEPAAGMEEPRS